MGTATSALAWLDESTGRSTRMAVDGEPRAPSDVYFADDCVLVGKEATKAGRGTPDRLIRGVKRFLVRRSRLQPVGGTMLPAEAIAACLLKPLLAECCAALGPDLAVAIGVPATFGDRERLAVVHAAEIAGVPLVGLVNETTAAALVWCEQAGLIVRAFQGEVSERILICDLGASTFQAAVFEVAPGCVRTVAADGNNSLGGEDWDRWLTRRVQGSSVGDDAAISPQLRQSVQDAKHTLSVRRHVSMECDVLGHSRTLSREEFEAGTTDLVERLISIVESLLASAGMTWDDLAHVVLVGGGSRMPMVRRVFHSRWKKVPTWAAWADDAVARGAAIYADYVRPRSQQDAAPPWRLTDITTRDLQWGAIARHDSSTEKRGARLAIRRGMPLPAEATATFLTREEGQRSMSVPLYESRGSSNEDAKHIGHVIVERLPRAIPQSWPVDVTLRCSAGGCVTASAEVRALKANVGCEIERAASMSPIEVRQYRRILAKSCGLRSLAGEKTAWVATMPSEQSP